MAPPTCVRESAADESENCIPRTGSSTDGSRTSFSYMAAKGRQGSSHKSLTRQAQTTPFQMGGSMGTVRQGKLVNYGSGGLQVMSICRDEQRLDL